MKTAQIRGPARFSVQVESWSDAIDRQARRRRVSWDDVNIATTEANGALSQSHQRVIAAELDEIAGLPARSALAHDD